MTSESVDETQTEVADLTALPLFAQPLPANGQSGTHRSPSGPRLVRPIDSTGGAGPAAGVDWSLVAALRAQASEQLSQAVAADRARLDKTAQEELGRSARRSTRIRSRCSPRTSSSPSTSTPRNASSTAR